MLTGVRKQEPGVSPRTCLIFLLVTLLTFPQWAFADGIAWNGSAGDGSYGNADNWTCATCSPATYPNNGNSGLNFDATINSGGTDNVNLDVANVFINSLTLGGSGSSTLNTSGNSIQFGDPSVATSNVLSVGNGGTLNINSGSNVTLELSPVGSGAQIASGGLISVTDSGTLTLQNNNLAGGNRTLTNNGNVSVTGVSSAATLNLNDGGSQAGFTLSGSGTLALSGLGQISGQVGDESLTNDFSHTISGDGSILNLANVTNNGTLHASTSAASLTVASNLTNWDSGSNTLTGGTYAVDNGATLQLSSIGSGNSIQNLAGNATVSVNGSGLITGDGATNSLSGLTSITDSNLNLTGVTQTITPGGSPATLTLAATDSGTPASLTLDGSSNITVSGAFTNSVDTTGNSGEFNGTSTLNIQGGSTLTTGAFLNLSQVGLPSSNITNSANANVNVTGGSTLNVDSLTTSTNNGFSNSNISVDNSALNVTNDFAQGGVGPNFSSGGDNLTLTNNAKVSVGGNFYNNNGLNGSNVTLDNSSLSVDGTFTQMQGNGGFGESTLSLTNNSIATLGGLSSGNGVSNGVPQASVSVTGNSSLTILGNGTFTNVSSGGVLSGGSYFIGNGSSLNYTGADINTIDTNTVLTLDNDGGTTGTTGTVTNSGHDAISNSLSLVTGTLTIQNGASLVLGSSVPSFTNNGTVNVSNGSIFDVSATTFTNESGGVLSGGTLAIADSTMKYAGNDINTIDFGANLILGGTGTLVNVNSSNPDALSATLSTVNGAFTLENNANMTLTAAVPSFQNNGVVNIFSGSTFDVTATNFLNESGGTLSGGTFEIGDGSQLKYAGNDIQTIDNNTYLILDGVGKLVNVNSSNPDALSATLNTVNGSLTLQNNANMAFTAASFTNNGYLGVLSGSTLDLTGTTFTNESGGVLSGGSFEVGNQSTLKYAGNDINTIDVNTSLTLDGTGTLVNVNSSNPDALSATLNTVNGTFTLQNNAKLTLTGAQSFFTNNGGTVNVLSGSTLDVSATTFTNESGGVLGGGAFEIGNNSVLNYAGNDINTIDTTASLTLDGTGKLVNTLSGNSDALSNTLTTVNGSLTLQNSANLTLSGTPFFNNNFGFVSVLSGSTLDLTNTTFQNESFQSGIGGVLSGGNFEIGDTSVLRYSGDDIALIDATANLTLDGSGKLVNINSSNPDALSNTLNTIAGQLVLQNNASLTLSQDVVTTGSVVLNSNASLTALGQYTNQANFFTGPASLALNSSTMSVANTLSNLSYGPQATITLNNSSLTAGSLMNATQAGFATSEIDLTRSSLAVTGNVSNLATTPVSGPFGMEATINLDHSSLTVGGTFKNDSQNGDGFATLSLENNSTAVITGLLSNNGNSVIQLDATGHGGSTLTANGGVSNYNSSFGLLNNSTLTVLKGFTNSSDDSGYGENEALLYLGPNESPTTTNEGGPTSNTNQSRSFGAPSTATITGGLSNTATTSLGGLAESDVVVLDGSTLNTDTLTNTATANTVGGGDFADAEVSLSGGGNLHVTGVVTNSAFFAIGSSFEASSASISLDGGSNMTVGGTFNNTNAALFLTNQSTATVSGLFTNDANSLVSLDDQSSFTLSEGKSGLTPTTSLISAVTGSTLNTTGFSNAGEVDLDDQSTIANTGVFTNSGFVGLSNTSLLTSTGLFDNSGGNLTLFGGGNQVTAVGFTNTGGQLNVAAGDTADFRGAAFTDLSGGTLKDGSYVIGGTFQFDASSGVINQIGANAFLSLDAENGGLYQVLSGTANALANLSGNAGSFSLINGAVLTTDTTANGGPGTFTNSGSIYTGNAGSNALHVTGNFTNTVSGTINLNGVSDALTASGQFTNAGAVTLSNNQASISSAGFDNQANATVTFWTDHNTITSTAGATNEGTITMNGTNGKISTAAGDFTNTGTITTAATGSSNSVNVTGNIFNTSPGAVNLNGAGDNMTATGQFVNSGSVTLAGANAYVSSVGFDNKGGTVTLSASGNSVTSTGTAGNEGTISFNGNSGSVSSTSDFTNGLTGLITVTGSGNVLSSGGTLFNVGGLTVGGGGSVTAVGLDQSGSLTVNDGGTVTITNTLDQTAGMTTVNVGGALDATLIDLTGGILTGGGTINGNLTVDGGTLQPGDPQSIDVFGNYDQTLAGILDLDMADVGAGNYDQLNVTGDASLDGLLELTLEKGFDSLDDIVAGDVFDIVNWTGSVSGNFTTFDDPTFNGLTFQESFNSNGHELDLDVVAVNSSTTATPEPSTLSMLLCAMLVGGSITWRVTRRRTKVVR